MRNPLGFCEPGLPGSEYEIQEYGRAVPGPGILPDVDSAQFSCGCQPKGNFTAAIRNHEAGWGGELYCL